jgi:hypothetical protein
VEVPGSVTDYETLVLVSVVVPDFASGVEVLDRAFEEVSEAAWGLLVLVGLPAATVLGLVLVSEDPELEVLGYGLALEGHASVLALASWGLVLYPSEVHVLHLVVYQLESVLEASEGEGLLEFALVQAVLAYLKNKVVSKLFCK